MRLEPAGKDVHWSAGRGIMVREWPDARVAAAFDDQENEYLRMRIEIENRSAAVMNVSPADVTYTTCEGPTVCQPETAVIDPEAMLIALDVRRSSERASQANAEAVGGALVMLSLVGAVASASSGNGDGVRVGLRNAALASYATDSSVAASEGRVYSLEQQRAAWASNAFRKSTLPPTQGAGGMVYLPIRTEATQVWVRVRAGARSTWFKWDQVLYAAETTAARAR